MKLTMTLVTFWTQVGLSLMAWTSVREPQTELPFSKSLDMMAANLAESPKNNWLDLPVSLEG